MKKDFESRFMPSCKFSIMGKNREIFNSLDIPLIHNYIRTSISGEIAALCDYQTWFEGWEEKEVSIYEAIPELIPDGMRYNKELDKLVPDVVSASNEYCSGIDLKNHRSYNIGSSNYAAMNIQPWDIWKDWKLDPWDADIIKRISRTKEIPGKSFEEARIEDYEKIKHICDEKIYQLKEKINAK